MDIQVKLNNFRTSPKKIRQVIDLVRGKNALQAQSVLLFTVNKSAKPILKLLNSAIASAKNDLHLDETNLFISKITVDEGPKLKRWHPMSRGRAYPIIKRSSHVVLVLSERNQVKKPDKSSKEHFDGPVTISPKASLVGEDRKIVKAKKIVKKPKVKKTIKK